jgi:hypothetical protein
MGGQNANQIGMKEVEKNGQQYFAHRQNKTEGPIWKKS